MADLVAHTTVGNLRMRDDVSYLKWHIQSIPSAMREVRENRSAILEEVNQW